MLLAHKLWKKYSLKKLPDEKFYKKKNKLKENMLFSYKCLYNFIKSTLTFYYFTALIFLFKKFPNSILKRYL
jgi:hypothetical protein